MRFTERNYIHLYKIETGGRCTEKIDRWKNQKKHLMIAKKSVSK